MGSVVLGDLMKKLPEREQRAIKRNARRLIDKYDKLDAQEAQAKSNGMGSITFREYLKTLPKSKQRAIECEFAEEKARFEAMDAQEAQAKRCATSDSVADVPLSPTKPAPPDNIYMAAKAK